MKSRFWQLYEEGLAMKFEHLILKRESWHMNDSNLDWISWCKSNISIIASEYFNITNSINKNETSKFFGSWYNFKGHSQTGYFLGHEVITELEKEQDLEKIAKLSINEINTLIPQILEKMIKI